MSAAPLVTGSVQPMVMSLYKLAPEHRYGQAVAMRVIAPSGAMDLGRDEIEWVRAPAG